ncbi:MAG: chorismate synthase, partial [Casimicrobiaceae bacterium]
ARLTAPIVAAGAVAKKWLAERFGVLVRGYCAQIGTVAIPFETWAGVNANPFFAPVAAGSPKIAELEAYMDALRKSGDSCGARLYVEASGVPVGWGEPLYDRLDADIAHAMMGLNAVKGVEIGAGFASVTQRGTEHSDQIIEGRFASNNAGGVLGGISTGQPITVSLAIKPTSSIRLDRETVNTAGEAVTINTEGRHDPCVGIRATPIAEALLAIVLMDHALRHRAQCADVRVATPVVQG